jgi:hypothetical protein
MRPFDRYLGICPSAKISRLFLPFPSSPLLKISPWLRFSRIIGSEIFPHTEHTPPTPERISGAIKPFIDHDYITTLTPHNTSPEPSFFEFSPRSVFLLGFKRIHPSISIHFGTLIDHNYKNSICKWSANTEKNQNLENII